MLSFANLFVPAVFFSYLITLPPTILWRDAPEFANVAFTLSIAHPAGFPIYSLLVKALTYIPVGNIAFKTNLASALFSLLTVILLTSALSLFMKRFYPSAPDRDIQIASILAALFFALGPLVWHIAISAEVYTLNTLFIAALIYCLLRWLDELDRHWLYLCAFLYGVSAGNHATVALFLPGLVAVYFFNRPERNSCEWVRAAFFFILGLSVYLYLPVRSLANPPYDWGDPESLKNLLYLITDQKDSSLSGHTPESSTTSLYLIFNHLGLIARQYSPAGIVLILLGIIPVLRKERGLALLLLWILFSNYAFFWGWTSGDASLPSYLVLSFFLGIGTYTLLGAARKWSQVTASRIWKLVGIGLVVFVLAHVVFTFPKTTKRGYYLPFDFYRPAFTGLQPEAILLTEHQWFHLKYFQDVERLREDISVFLLGEFLDSRDFNPLTPNRHPRLVLPARRQTSETRFSFLSRFLAENAAAGRPVFSELSLSAYGFFYGKLFPHQDFLLRFSEDTLNPYKPDQWDAYFEKLGTKMIRAGQSGGLRDRDLQTYLRLFANYLVGYFNANNQTLKQSLTLQRLHLQLHGPEGNNSIDEKQLSDLYNSIGLSELRRGETLNGLRSLELAMKYNPKNADPYLNLALWSLEKTPDQLGKILERARRNGLNPQKICDTLTDYFLKEEQTKLLEKAHALCTKTAKEND